MKQTMTLLMLCLLIPSPLAAQESLETLASVVRKVVEKDPGIQARQAAVEAAAADARQTESQRLPKLYVSVDTGEGKSVNDLANVLLTGLNGARVANAITRSRLADLSNSRSYFVPGARLEENLYDGGRTSAEVRSAWLAKDKTDLGEQKTIQDEAYTTASYYLNLARAQILQKDLGDYSDIAALAAKALSDQAKAGRITAAKALAGQAKAEEARTSVENDRDDMRLWSNLLRRLAALPPSAAFDTRPLEQYLAAFQPTPVPEEAEIGSSPDMKDATLDARIQEQHLREAESGRLPQIKFVAQYGFQFSNLLFTFRPGYNAGIEVDYPLFTSGETKRHIAAEEGRMRSASLKVRKTREVLSEEYERASEQNGKLARELQAARAELAQSEEVYRVARLKYDQGAGSALDLLEAAGLLLTSREHCLDLTSSSLLLDWSVLQTQGHLEASLEKGMLP
jgi:outer membrane protein TolC